MALVIKLTTAEAESIITRTMELHKETLPDEISRLKAMMGTIAIVDAMQLLGYRVSRPLKEVV